MRRLLLLLPMLFFQLIYIQAQEYVHQVLILNEGYFDYTTQQIIEPVTIGSYNPINQVYTEIAIIDSARFASDLIINKEDYKLTDSLYPPKKRCPSNFTKCPCLN